MSDLAERIRADVEYLCAAGDRDLGTEHNRRATDYVEKRLADAGLAVERIPFEVPEWYFGSARVWRGGVDIEIHPGPFSAPVEGQGRLVPVRSLDEIRAVEEQGAVLLLNGEIASTQFTPRDYPFYSDPAHAEILDALERVSPLAVLAATGKSAMTGAMSPFPLIEESRFAAPSAYMTEQAGEALAQLAGQAVSVTIDSGVRASSGVQPVGRRAVSRARRLVVSAHVDSKPETPGAIDNAAGVAVMLAAADLLRDAELSRTIEFVPFNGEDHTLAPGEMAWLSSTDLSDVDLAINIDAPGLRGSPAAYSLYSVADRTKASASAFAAETGSIVEGPQWPASDHMIFVMRGIPAVAITSEDFAAASGEYSHTAADIPEILDYEVLAQTARFVARLIESE